MMQSLLADRFKLVVHFEQRNVPVLALTLVRPGKLGPRLRPHADGPPCDLPASGSGSEPSPASGTRAGGSEEFPFNCGRYNLMPKPNHIILWGSRDATITAIGTWLPTVPPRKLGRPVVDQTGLSGKFDFSLMWEWMPPSNDAAPSGTEAQSDSQGPTLEDPLKEQLGLKLKLTIAPLDILVVDHVETPSLN
jgi:uncharacterized protein (TIGR03435 family)